MPFGLTNAPASFQGLMNSILQPLLRKCVAVFFDDILIFSANLDDHLHHLLLVFQTLCNHSLYAKYSKCVFGQPTIHYLGYVIFAQGVTMDPSKVTAILN